MAHSHLTDNMKPTQGLYWVVKSFFADIDTVPFKCIGTSVVVVLFLGVGQCE